MRFRVTEFEQLFSQSDLEKGFRLHKKKKAELIEKNGSHLGYLVAGHRISLHQSADEIDHCFCDCGKTFCQHVAAVMFSSLDIGAAARQRARKPALSSPSGQAFASAFARLGGFWKKTVAGGEGRSALTELLAQARQLLREGNFGSDLAVLAALSLPGRLAATSEAVNDLTNRIILRHFGSHLQKIDEEAMYHCVLELVRTNDRVASGRLNALLPVYLNFCADMFRLEELRTALSRRHLRKFHDEIFDELQISRNLVTYRAAQLAGREVNLSRSSSAESFVALARLFFAAQEVDKGWKIMDELKNLTRETAPLGYFSLLGYLVALGKALSDERRQLLYMEELMLYSPYLSSALVQSYIALLSPGSRESQVRALMQRIIETRSESAPDKLFTLTMASGITEPFLTVASRTRVRFYMIHEVFMKFNHAFNEEQFLIYFKSLSEGLLSPEPHQSPLTLLDAASQLFAALGSGGRQWFRKVTALLEDHPVLGHHKGYWERLVSMGTKPRRLVTLRA